MSEQAVRAWCRRNHVAKDAKGSFAISESQKTVIYQHYLGIERKQVSQPTKASCETCETSETVLIAMLQKELDRKNEQLSVKDKQITELNARLSECSAALVAAQQTAQAAPALPAGALIVILHAGTLQQQQQLIDGADDSASAQRREAGKTEREKKGWLRWMLGK